jgi:hypothetical protein
LFNWRCRVAASTSVHVWLCRRIPTIPCVFWRSIIGEVNRQHSSN